MATLLRRIHPDEKDDSPFELTKVIRISLDYKIPATASRSASSLMLSVIINPPGGMTGGPTVVNAEDKNARTQYSEWYLSA